MAIAIVPLLRSLNQLRHFAEGLPKDIKDDLLDKVSNIHHLLNLSLSRNLKGMRQFIGSEHASKLSDAEVYDYIAKEMTVRCKTIAAMSFIAELNSACQDYSAAPHDAQKYAALNHIYHVLHLLSHQYFPDRVLGPDDMTAIYHQFGPWLIDRNTLKTLSTIEAICAKQYTLSSAVEVTSLEHASIQTQFAEKWLVLQTNLLFILMTTVSKYCPDARSLAAADLGRLALPATESALNKSQTVAFRRLSYDLLQASNRENSNTRLAASLPKLTARKPHYLPKIVPTHSHNNEVPLTLTSSMSSRSILARLTELFMALCQLFNPRSQPRPALTQSASTGGASIARLNAFKTPNAYSESPAIIG